VEPFLVETLAPAFTMGTGVARAAEGIRINAHNEYRLFFNLGLSFRRSKWNFSRKIFGKRDGCVVIRKSRTTAARRVCSANTLTASAKGGVTERSFGVRASSRRSSA
jgi:hypothetical protein